MTQPETKDPMPEVQARMEQVRDEMMQVAALLKPLGMRMRVLISLESPSGTHRQWKLSTET